MAEQHPDPLRAEAIELLRGRGAHMPFDEAVADFPDEAINSRPSNLSYTPWQLLEHVRRTQRDILEYARDRASYRERHWPDDYWPAPDATTDRAGFVKTIEGFRADADALEVMVRDPGVDLLAPLSGTPGHTLLREIRLVGDHNAYHVGEFAVLRQVMGTWPAEREG